MAKTYFVTGTDTGVGKTLVTAALLQQATARGLTTLGLKPLAAGATPTDAGLRNEDALLLQQHSSAKISYGQTNPVCLEAAVAPHIAAARHGSRLSLDRLEGFVRGALMTRADLRLIEGAGGWRVPLSEIENLSGLPKRLELPVILVIGLRLGCLNHAFLTAEAILNDGLKLAGIVAVSLEPQLEAEAEILATLQYRLPVPFLGHVPWLAEPNVAAVAECLYLDPLL